MKRLIDFYADWCMPCKMLEPVIKELSDIIEIEKVNVDASPELAESFNVFSLPTIIVIGEDGNEIKRFVGTITKKDIEDII